MGSQTIGVETVFLFAVVEEEIFVKIPEGISEVLEEHYTYKDILALIYSIYVLIQPSHFWFKEYIKTMTLKAGSKQFKTYPCF